MGFGEGWWSLLITNTIRVLLEQSDAQWPLTAIVQHSSGSQQ
jgi:hypothetical protein